MPPVSVLVAVQVFSGTLSCSVVRAHVTVAPPLVLAVQLASCVVVVVRTPQIWAVEAATFGKLVVVEQALVTLENENEPGESGVGHVTLLVGVSSVCALLALFITRQVVRVQLLDKLLASSAVQALKLTSVQLLVLVVQAMVVEPLLSAAVWLVQVSVGTPALADPSRYVMEQVVVVQLLPDVAAPAVQLFTSTLLVLLGVQVVVT